MTRWAAPWLVMALLVPLLSACTNTLTDDGRPRVVTAFYALQYAAQRIVGDHAIVVNLTHPGMEPHDLELGVQQTETVYDADLVVYERGFQSAVDQAVEQTDPKHVVNATAIVDVTPDNPHFWLDPAKMTQVAAAVKDQMSVIDPSHATDYMNNFRTFEKELAKIETQYASGLAHCAITTTVVTHDAFGALDRYGLQFVSINGLSPDAEPSPSHIKTLHDLIESDGITTVFSEPLSSTEMANTISADLGLDNAVLDPIEGPSNNSAAESDNSSHQDYLSLMRANLVALRKANRCS